MTNTDTMLAIINQITETGRQQGLTQAQIAEAAGLSSEALSRAKKNPNIHLENLVKLARAVGLKPILVPDDPVIEKIERGGLFER